MKFLTKLPKEKRQQLLVVTLVTVIALGALGFGLIRYQFASLARAESKKAETAQKLAQMRDYIKQAARVDAELAESRKLISETEGDLASGDLYSWVISAIRGFKNNYKVDIAQITPNGPPTDVSLLAQFPYKQGSFSVTGSAYYHELGKFLADFENEFPHIRVLNLDLRLNPSPTTGDKEKLAFKMDIVTLVKSNPS